MRGARLSAFLPGLVCGAGCFWLGSLLLVAAPLEAGPDPAGWDIARLMQSLSLEKATRARFTEQKHMSILNQPLMTSGLLEFHAPDRLVKHVLDPYEERYLVVNDTLVIEQPGRGSSRQFILQRYPAMWAFVEGLRGTLAGNVELLRRFYTIDLRGAREHWHLNLEPLDDTMREMITSIRIQGTDGRIRSIEILEKNGDRSVMTIVPESP
jgi:hypothetical protein